MVRTVVDSGTTSPPTCDEQGFTGETNNLTLTSTAIPPPENAPVYLMASHLPVLPGHPASPFGLSLVFTESNADGVVQVDCADALTIGDTHLTTFSGLHYDFQASGDFVLLDSSGFSVHVRQVSGAPTWPNTAINKAIVAQMDGTRVEIYVEPERLYVDGKPTTVADDEPLLPPTGVQVVHHGSEYDITGAGGNAVRATLYGVFIDVTVGVGKTPARHASGLLGTPWSERRSTSHRGRRNTERAGLLQRDLYNKYGESWRVPAAKRLFTEEIRTTAGNPDTPIFAQDLISDQKAHALAACKAAGIVNQDLLDDCTLDTTVLHDDVAVNAFTKVHGPIRVIRPVLQAKPAAQ
ncbi:MAG: VWD domain-containing protein [Xanthobacteraceae bacterium]